jgi:hypothetical protein
VTQQSRPWTGDFPLGAIILIAVGVLLLLQTTGVVAWDVWASLWRFWPVILIVIGINILLGRRAPAVAAAIALLLLGGVIAGAIVMHSTGVGRVASAEDVPLGSTKAANVSVKFGAGDLTIAALPIQSPLLMQGAFNTPGGAAQVTTSSAGDHTSVRVRSPNARWFGSTASAQWQITLNQAVQIALELDAGAADLNLDLRDLKVTALDIDVGASDLELILPAYAGHLTMNVNAGASDITLTVPDGVAARVTRTSGVASFTVDTQRFPQSGNRYESPDFASATNRADIQMTVGAASVRIR